MTEDRLPLAELLGKAGDGECLRAVAEAVMLLLMEAGVEGMIGAGRYERTPERATCRNGYRDRSLDTRLGQGRAGSTGLDDADICLERRVRLERARIDQLQPDHLVISAAGAAPAIAIIPNSQIVPSPKAIALGRGE